MEETEYEQYPAKAAVLATAPLYTLFTSGFKSIAKPFPREFRAASL